MTLSSQIYNSCKGLVRIDPEKRTSLYAVRDSLENIIAQMPDNFIPLTIDAVYRFDNGDQHPYSIDFTNIIGLGFAGLNLYRQKLIDQSLNSAHRSYVTRFEEINAGNRDSVTSRRDQASHNSERNKSLCNFYCDVFTPRVSEKILAQKNNRQSKAQGD